MSIECREHEGRLAELVFGVEFRAGHMERLQNIILTFARGNNYRRVAIGIHYIGIDTPGKKMLDRTGIPKGYRYKQIINKSIS